MKSHERGVVINGSINILHQGLFRLIETECVQKNLLVQYSKEVRQFRLNHPSERFPGCYQLAILCLEYGDFFPRWLSKFLTLTWQAEGNVLVFTDSLDLLNQRKKGLLNRLCEIEDVMDASMPVESIKVVLKHHLSKQHTQPVRCKISKRELSVLDGFLNGIDARTHSMNLGIETKTLYQHRKNCANKLGVRNLKDLLRL